MKCGCDRQSASLWTEDATDSCRTFRRDRRRSGEFLAHSGEGGIQTGADHTRCDPGVVFGSERRQGVCRTGDLDAYFFACEDVDRGLESVKEALPASAHTI